MSKLIDAKGKPCPMPVILAKKEMENGETSFVVEVDNEIAVQNLTKLAENQCFKSSFVEKDGVYSVSFEADACAAAIGAPKGEGSWALFVTHPEVGGPSEELGGNLMRMLFYTLSQGDRLPKSILFMNGGVKLPCLDEQIVASLKELEEKGCEILVCGTCLNYYEIAGELKVGTVSNMYDILGRCQDAAKVVTL